ncbi:MAG: glycosyltransferase [Terriglobales bacterium]
MSLGYVLSRYPLLSETFILREMWALERQGERLRVYPLRRVRGPRHERVATIAAPVWWAPWLALASHLYWLRRQPARYLSTLAAVLWRNRSDANLLAGALAYWGKAVAIARQMERDGVRHVHAHYATHPALVAYIVHRLLGVPFSFTAHAHDIYCHRAMLAEKLRRARAVAAISEHNRELLAEAAPPGEREAARAKLHLVHCGIEVERYRELAERRWQAPGPAPGPLRVLAVGSLQPYKGHTYLIAACGRLRAAGDGFACRIVGAGELRRALERQRDRLGLGEAVEFTGPATEGEVMAALAWAQVLAMPSIVERSGKMEGIPVALMEAMAAGVAVVASRLPGITELIESGRDGLLVPAGSAEALAEALGVLRDVAWRERLGRSALLRVEAGFELQSNVRRLRQLWQPAGAPVGAAT